jgi:hypothetical protein
MAINFKFKCDRQKDDFLEVEELGGNVWINGIFQGNEIEFCFDKTTAIRFAKTVRTEINKIQ